MNFRFILNILTLFCILNSGSLFAQLNNSSPADDFYPFTKGNFILTLGTNFNSDVAKNEDRTIEFVIDEKNTRFNIKLGLGYMVADGHPLIVGFRYFNDKSESLYTNVLGDTISNKTLEREYITNIGYGINKPLFGSKKVYMVSDPSLFFSFGDNKSDRVLEGSMERSTSKSYSLSAGLNVGLMVFISPKMSVQATVGPVGVGYKWEDFELDGENNGSTSDFFIRMSPNLLNFEFSISRYF